MQLSKLSNNRTITEANDTISQDDLLKTLAVVCAFATGDTKKTNALFLGIMDLIKKHGGKILQQEEYAHNNLLTEHQLAAMTMFEVDEKFGKFLLESIPTDSDVARAIQTYPLLKELLNQVQFIDHKLQGDDDEFWNLVAAIVSKIIRNKYEELSTIELRRAKNVIIADIRKRIIEHHTNIMNTIYEYAEALNVASLKFGLLSKNPKIMLEAKNISNRKLIKAIAKLRFGADIPDNELDDLMLQCGGDPDASASGASAFAIAKDPNRVKRILQRPMSQKIPRLHFKRDIYSRRHSDDLVGIGSYLGQGGMFLDGLMNLIIGILTIGGVTKHLLNPIQSVDSIVDENMAYTKRIIVAVYKTLQIKLDALDALDALEEPSQPTTQPTTAIDQTIPIEPET